ncbi:MAG: DUF5989 family protein [Pirellulaceae bacterium]
MTDPANNDDLHAPAESPSNSNSSSDAEFEQLAEQASPGILREFFDFLRYNKKWWMAPIVIVLLLAGLVILLTATPVGPFIYTFF